VLFVAAPMLVRHIARLKAAGSDSGMEAKGWGG
jgi:hypothetical protein